MKIARERIFGPVAPIIPAEGLDDALARANQTSFGLSSAVFGRHVERATASRSLSSLAAYPGRM